MTTSKQIETITDAEWEVMRVVWAKSQTTSNEIIKILKEKKKWQPSTVKTLLSRLVVKGYLVTQKEGKQLIYFTAINQDDAIKDNRERFLTKICQKKIGGIVIDMVTENELSLKDIQTLELLLDKKKKTAKQEVPCLCLKGQCSC